MESNPRENGSANKDPKSNTEVTSRLRPTPAATGSLFMSSHCDDEMFREKDIRTFVTQECRNLSFSKTLLIRNDKESEW
jgi:hypothetical protein